MPAGRVLVVKFALPLVTVPVPSVAEPIRKVTVPVGAGSVAGRARVRVSAEPTAMVGADDVRTSVGVALATVTVSGAEVTAEKLLLPAKVAVMESVPMGRPGAGTVRVAVPVLSRAWLPRTVVPFLKAMLAVGSVPVTVMVAFSVIGLPKVVEGAGVVRTRVGVGKGTVMLSGNEVAGLLFESPE